MLKKKSFLLMLTIAMISILAIGCSSNETSTQAEGQGAKNKETASSKEELDYPKKPIKIIVPWKAGGDTDVINRVAAKYLEKELDEKIVITNIGGGGGSIGAKEAIQAQPDGYTILAGHDSIAISNLMGNTDFSYFDFEPVSMLTTANQLIATHVDNPWNSMTDVGEELKKSPESISMGATLGSTTHMVPLGINEVTGTKFNIVSYEGTAQRTQALLGKHLDLGTTTIPAAKEYIKANQLKMLAIASEERNPALPDVPTLKEQGIDFVNATNRGFFFPKGTPKEIVQLVSDAIGRVAQNPEFIKEMENMGINVNYKNVDEYNSYLKKDMETNTKILKNQGIVK
jgi:tripartite-type tricarboxylate transporter receptor subunit TctC